MNHEIHYLTPCCKSLSAARHDARESRDFSEHLSLCEVLWPKLLWLHLWGRHAGDAETPGSSRDDDLGFPTEYRVKLQSWRDLNPRPSLRNLRSKSSDHGKRPAFTVLVVRLWYERRKAQRDSSKPNHRGVFVDVAVHKVFRPRP